MTEQRHLLAAIFAALLEERRLIALASMVGSKPCRPG